MASEGRLSKPASNGADTATAWVLSLAGAVPFVAAAVALVVLDPGSPWFGWFVDVARTYGAIILSFVGGIRWGAALGGSAGTAPAGSAGILFFLSVIPSLAGWFSLALAPVSGFAFLIAAFVVQGIWDAFSGPPTFAEGAAAGRLPSWFVRLRIAITAIVVASLLVALVVVA